jgi:hypothetical protein
MEHAEARELLEIAAVEPGGFERLVAGDTPEAAALAGHLAGCNDCASEMERLRRSAAVIRDAVRILPPPELRERTLAYVAALGRPRGTAAGTGAGPVGGTATIEFPGRAAEPRPTRRNLGGVGARPAVWALSLAAAIVVAVVGTTVLVGGSRDRQIADQAEEIGSLRDIATWTIRLDRQADAQHVALASATGGVATGTLIFSPTSTDVVVVATGLAAPPAGSEYRCWVETGGVRKRIGRMFLGEGLAYWHGAAASITSLAAGSTFGVSLVPAEGDSVGGDPVLVGQS